MSSSGFENQQEPIQQLLSSRSYRLAKQMMVILRKICRCPLVDEFYPPPRRESEGPQETPSKVRPSASYEKIAIRNGPWSDGLLVCFVLSTCHLCLYVYHQYKLNWNLIRLDYLGYRHDADSKCQRCSQDICPFVKAISQELLRQLNQTIKHENESLDLLGLPIRELGFFGAGFNLIMFLCSFVAYIVTQFNFKIVQPFDQYILRIFIDYKRELELSSNLVDKQVDEFIASHRNASRTTTLLRTDQIFDVNIQRRAIEEVQVHMAQDRFIERELMLMRASGELMPPNRSAEWILSWLKIYLAINISGFLFSVAASVTLITLIYFSPLLRPNVNEPWLDYSIGEWVVILEVVLFLFLINCSIIMYGATLTFSQIDQYWFASHLLKLHEQFLTRSQRLLNSPEKLTNKLIRYGLNLHLLVLLMKFRIFAKQLACQRRIDGLNTFILVSCFFLLAALSRLHAPYIESHLIGVKLFIVIVSVFTLIPVSFGLLAPCKMFSRCMCLHRTRVKVLAHVVRAERSHPSLFSDHLVSRLRRETSFGDRLADEFAISFGGFKFTYSSVMSFYFWYGILILSAIMRPSNIIISNERDYAKMMEDDAGDSQVKHHYPLMMESSFLDDPFGILKW